MALPYLLCDCDLLADEHVVLDLMEEKGAQADSRVELGASIWI
jgi:hypothetical protein